jgi:hypothetical protein
VEIAGASVICPEEWRIMNGRCDGTQGHNCQRPVQNQSADMSYFAQTPDAEGGNANDNRYAIATRSVFIQLDETGTRPGVRGLAPKHVGRKGIPCKYLQFCKKNRGAAAGAVATMFVGFYWGGWSLGSTADKMAKERSELAVIAALAPVCADKFRALPDADAKQAALSKIESWKRRDEFPKEFVTLPGESYPSSALVDACSTLLLAPKSAALK